MRNRPRESSASKVIYLTPTKNINVFYAELGSLLEVITHAVGLAMGLHLTDMFKPCEDCTLGKAKKSGVSDKAVEHSKVLGERLFFESACI